MLITNAITNAKPGNVRIYIIWPAPILDLCKLPELFEVTVWAVNLIYF